MSDETLEQCIKKYLNSGVTHASFGWQGGEPTLAELDFFRKAVEYQNKYKAPDQMISNALQTNGTLLNDEWGDFLHKHQFLTGISIDGPAEIHDKSRFNAEGQGSHQLVMRGLSILKKHHADFNVLTLVSAANKDNPKQIYEYIKSTGAKYHQYIECIEFDSSGNLMPFALKKGDWGNFLCGIFDEWYKKDTRTISIRLFDSILMYLVYGMKNSCAAGTDCRNYFVVEHNGDVFPCDFYVQPDLKLGNIADGNFQDFQDAKLYSEFGARKRNWNPVCNSCEFLNFCGGCCQKNRPMRGNPPDGLSVLCEDWKIFYQHSLPRFRTLAEEVKKEASSKKQPAADRNAPCPCGSGLKYKKCCGK